MEPNQYYTEHCGSQNMFGETQSANRKHGCTTDHFLKLTHPVSEAFQWSEKVGFVCLDFEKRSMLYGVYDCFTN